MIRTESIEVRYEEVLRKWVEFLITRSCWFSIMPLPDDVWEISVKANEGDFIHDHHLKMIALHGDTITTAIDRGHGGYDDRDQT